MRLIHDLDQARAVLDDVTFVVPPVPPATSGIAWLRATVGRFAEGTVHERRRAAQIAILDTIPPETLRGHGPAHPVEILARAMGVDAPIVESVREAAQAYQPGTGDESRADAAVTRLVAVFGGVHDEATAARIGLLVQACDATATLIERSRDRGVAEVLRDDPPVVATKRQATITTTIGGITIGQGEIVRVRLAGETAFGSGPRRCPGRVYALALAEGKEES
ncbi:hypothetical protein [Actinoplanes couchii]|uniref:DUF222 domain-containing protein n=1 Tax=Actinoplanes couchii TaxID=403638 RepID=A0ABQ3X7T2_9ACTN|nr:hypothetical protein [Actinoplanes couchii]MDR6320408.1 hypothetical protein [Actinoplanes couchii]GID54580.1 hypothetical protein Aco03nite_029840 [Actinoplanes couchii]